MEETRESKEGVDSHYAREQYWNACRRARRSIVACTSSIALQLFVFGIPPVRSTKTVHPYNAYSSPIVVVCPCKRTKKTRRRRTVTSCIELYFSFFKKYYKINTRFFMKNHNLSNRINLYGMAKPNCNIALSTANRLPK